VSGNTVQSVRNVWSDDRREHTCRLLLLLLVVTCIISLFVRRKSCGGRRVSGLLIGYQHAACQDSWPRTGLDQLHSADVSGLVVPISIADSTDQLGQVQWVDLFYLTCTFYSNMCGARFQATPASARLAEARSFRERRIPLMWRVRPHFAVFSKSRIRTTIRNILNTTLSSISHMTNNEYWVIFIVMLQKKCVTLWPI